MRRKRKEQYNPPVETDSLVNFETGISVVSTYRIGALSSSKELDGVNSRPKTRIHKIMTKYPTIRQHILIITELIRLWLILTHWQYLPSDIHFSSIVCTSDRSPFVACVELT